MTEPPPRVARLGVTLAWARYPEWPAFEPRYRLHEGRDVEWEAWEVAFEITHVTFECETCGYDGQPWFAMGKVFPLPGDRFRGTTRALTRAGSQYLRDYDVQAYPVWRLTAYLCPACDDLRIYDRHSRSGFTEIHDLELIRR